MARCFHILRKNRPVRNTGTGTTNPVTPPRRARWSYTESELLAKARLADGYDTTCIQSNRIWILGIQATSDYHPYENEIKNNHKKGHTRDMFYIFNGDRLKMYSPGTTYAGDIHGNNFTLGETATTREVIKTNQWHKEVWSVETQDPLNGHAPYFRNNGRMVKYDVELQYSRHNLPNPLPASSNSGQRMDFLPLVYNTHAIHKDFYASQYPQLQWKKTCQVIDDYEAFLQTLKNCYDSQTSTSLGIPSYFRVNYCLLNEWTS